ncbi:MAG: hypothetical protein AB2L14_00735 [Candidatus Xenobiia bacterium LiM19]
MDRMFGWTPEDERRDRRLQIQENGPLNEQCTDEEILEAKKFWEYRGTKDEYLKYLNLQFEKIIIYRQFSVRQALRSAGDASICTEFYE